MEYLTNEQVMEAIDLKLKGEYTEVFLAGLGLLQLEWLDNEVYVYDRTNLGWEHSVLIDDRIEDGDVISKYLWKPSVVEFIKDYFRPSV